MSFKIFTKKKNKSAKTETKELLKTRKFSTQQERIVAGIVVERPPIVLQSPQWETEYLRFKLEELQREDVILDEIARKKADEEIAFRSGSQSSKAKKKKKEEEQQASKQANTIQKTVDQVKGDLGCKKRQEKTIFICAKNLTHKKKHP